MTVFIRKLEETDIPQCADLIRQAFATAALEFGLTRENCPANGAFIADDKIRADMARKVTMFGLFEENVQIGFVALKKKNASTWYIEKLAVRPEFRRQGYGGRLLLHAVEQIRLNGGLKISIGIINDNKRLRQWYERYGFVVVGSRHFTSLPFTVCYMELCLEL